MFYSRLHTKSKFFLWSISNFIVNNHKFEMKFWNKHEFATNGFSSDADRKPEHGERALGLCIKYDFCALACFNLISC